MQATSFSLSSLDLNVASRRPGTALPREHTSKTVASAADSVSLSINAAKVSALEAVSYGSADTSSFNTYNSQGLLASQESLKYQSFSLEYTNKDGDSMHLEYAYAQYQKIDAAAYGIPSQGSDQNAISDSKKLDKKQLKEIMDTVKSAMLEARQQLIKSLVEGSGGKFRTIDIAQAFENVSVEELEANMPEEWNAENTAQRIVDFATSFFKGSKEELGSFLEKIKNAIGSGFGEAKEIIGEVPNPVAGLAQKTFDLAMQKLDEWAKNLEQPAEQTAANAVLPA